MNILGIVPARAGSKRVERKNVRDLAGKPLIAHTFEVAKQCNSLSRLIVSTNDPEVVEIANKMGIEVPFIRPEEFCTDTATDFDWVKHAVEELSKSGWDADYVVILRPTQPIRKVEDINNAIEKIINSERDVSSVRSLTKIKHHPYWMKTLDGDLAKPFINLGKPDEKLRSQDLPELYHLNGIVDVIKATNINQDLLYGNKMSYTLIEEKQAVDIDTLEDFRLAENLISSNSTDSKKVGSSQKIVLVGAREDGHLGVVLDIIKEHLDYEVVGLIDDQLELQGKTIKTIPVIGTLNIPNLPPETEGFFVCSGNNEFRERCHYLFKDRGLTPVNVIHPSAIISQSSKMGVGVFIAPNVVVGHNVIIGDGVLINTAATIDHDNILEDFTNFCPGTHIAGRCKIKKSAFLGTGVKLIPDITIEENAIVGAGAVVINNVLSGTTVVGVPAKQIKGDK